MPVSIQFASETSAELALEIASPLIEEFAPLEAASVMIHEDDLFTLEVEIEITPASKPEPATAVAQAEEITLGSGDVQPLWTTTEEPLAVCEETAATEAQEKESPSRNRQRPLTQRFAVNDNAPKVGKTSRLWVITKAKISARQITKIGNTPSSANPVTRQESLSWLKENSLPTMPTMEVGTLFRPIPIRESLTWLKEIKLLVSWPSHALTLVGFGKLLSF